MDPPKLADNPLKLQKYSKVAENFADNPRVLVNFADIPKVIKVVSKLFAEIF